MMLQTGALSRFPVQYHRHQIASGHVAGPVATSGASGRDHRQIWFANSFDHPRNGGTNRHDAIDIFGPIGVPVVSPVSGTTAADWWVGGSPRPGVGGTGEGDGGFYVVVIDRDQGLYHYFSHLREAPRVPAATVVEAGRLLGYLGDSGRARGNPHLHYQVSRRNRRGALLSFFNPYNELRRLAGEFAVTPRTNTRVEIPVSSGGPD